MATNGANSSRGRSWSQAPYDPSSYGFGDGRRPPLRCFGVASQAFFGVYELRKRDFSSGTAPDFFLSIVVVVLKAASQARTHVPCADVPSSHLECGNANTTDASEILLGVTNQLSHEREDNDVLSSVCAPSLTRAVAKKKQCRSGSGGKDVL